MPDYLVVGVVIPAVPGYSETFFRNKFMGLQKRDLKLCVFAAGPSNGFNLCPYYPQPPVQGFFPFAWIQTINSLMLAIFKRPKAIKYLYNLERAQGNSLKAVIKTILSNTHILRHHLDWLHFEFGTMAIGRENLSQAIGARMSVSLRGFDIAIYPLKHPDCYELMWKRLDKLHVISDDLKVLAQKNGLNEKTPVVKITPATDIESFKRSRAFSEKSYQPLKILTVARLHWKKGLEDSLRALLILKEKRIPFQYTLIGEGEEYERLIFTAHQLGISDYVSFAGKKAPEEVKNAMEETDIYLQYSISEGFCNAVLEAQAMGCLCVVSDAEGLPENVVHEETGWVVPKIRPDFLAAQIIEILGRSEDKLNKVRTHAITRVHDEFGLEKQIQAFVEFYQG